MTINWGLEEEASLPLKSTSTGSVVQIGNREFIGITQHNLVRFETSVISNYLPYQLSALVSIRDQQILVGVTSISWEFVVILLNDIKKPIYTKIKTNDASIFNIIYLPKSSLLITSGEDLKVWHFDYYYNSKSIIPTEPRLKIEYQRTIVSKYQGSIMNPPIVDYQTEILYLDDNNGTLQKYKATTGENVGCALKYQSKSKTTIALNPETKKILVSNADQGTVLYHKSGSFNARFLLTNVATLAIRFINKEYAILLDANNLIRILDVKTSRSFVCYKGEKRIKRLFLFNEPVPRLILCFNTRIIIFRIVLPWTFWKTTISSPLSMTRCSKINEAARLLVMCSNSHLKLISPSIKATLTAVTLSSLASPFYNNYFYDRGDENVKRDQLMLPLKDGQIQFFSTGENPCKLISSLDAKARCISLCKYKNKKCFVFGTSNGNLLFYDYENLNKVNRVVLLPFPIIKIFYCSCGDSDDSLCLVFEDQLVRFSISDEKMCESVKICGSEISISFNDVILFGYENGEIGSVYFDKTMKCKLVEHFTNGLKIHDDKITGLSLGLDSDYFASCSLDMSLRIWTTKEITLIKKIVFPVQLFSVAVLNGKRDIVVGTDYEIMRVDGELIFNGVVDEENDEFDNFDKKFDFLSSQFSQIGKENETENEESFLESRKKNNQLKKPVNNKIRKFNEALKKHEEMLNKQLSDFNLNMEEKNNHPSKKNGIDPDERERLFNQMNEITNGKPKKPVVIPKIENKKEENQYEYEYYEYEEIDEYPENNKRSSKRKSSRKNIDSNETIVIEENSIESNSNDSKTENDDNLNKNETELNIKEPSNKNGYRSPKRNFRRGVHRNHPTSSNEINNDTTNYDYYYDYDNNYSNEDSDENENNHINHKNRSNHKSRNKHGNHKSRSKFSSHKSRSKHHKNKNNDDSDYYYDDDLYDDDDNDESRSRKKNKNKHHLKNHSQNNHEIENENVTIKTSINAKSKNNQNHTLKTTIESSSNIHNPTSSQQNNHKNSHLNNHKSHHVNNHKNSQVNNHTTSTNDQESSQKNRSKIDRRTKMNLFLVNSSISDAYNNNFSNKHDHKEIRSNSSLDKKIFIQTGNQSQSQAKMLKIKATRRFPTPLGYHFVHPGLSLFERSLKPRRPKTPDKHNNGIIISRSIVPTSIILDASVLDCIIESEDNRYRPLLNQIRPLLRSHYNYYNGKMRNLGRYHAFFNLNVMIPAYQRNRQQIKRRINDFYNNVPPIKIDEISTKSNQNEKPRSLLNIGKISHSYDYKNNAALNRNRMLNESPRIFKLNRKNFKRKESCPPRINKNVVLDPLPQTSRNLNNDDNSEYNNFIYSLCNQRDRKVIHQKKKSMSLALPKDSLYVTGKLMNVNSPRITKKDNEKKENSKK